MAVVIQGLVPIPFPLEGDEILRETRVTDYRFEILDGNDNLVGTLDGVEAGGSVDFTASDAIKSSGRLTVHDVGQEVDWLNVRIKPYIILNTEVGQTDGEEHACGVYVPVAPVERWSGGQRSWDVELLDKLVLLDQDIPSDSSTGRPVTYAAPKGANVIDCVKALVESIGASSEHIQPSDKTLNDAMTWSIGASKLKIINDLLEAANFNSLWCDEDGNYRSEPYVRPVDREVKYEALDPFSEGRNALMSPSWEMDNDIYSVPNRFVAIGRGTESDEAPVGSAVNNDPGSPYSFASRGRWITEVMTGVDATSVEDLNEIAERQLALRTSVSRTVSVRHAYLPDLRINDVVRFSSEQAEADLLTVVTSTTIVFDPNGLCGSELRAV